MSTPSLASPVKPVPGKWEGLRLPVRAKPISWPLRVSEIRLSSWVSNHREPSNREESKNWKWNLKKACCMGSYWVPPFPGKQGVSISRKARSSGASSKHWEPAIHPTLFKTVTVTAWKRHFQIQKGAERLWNQFRKTWFKLVYWYKTPFLLSHSWIQQLQQIPPKKKKKQQRGFFSICLLRENLNIAYILKFNHKNSNICVQISDKSS